MELLRALSFGSRKSVPLITQSEATECGLACLAMIASYHGYRTDLRSLRRRFSISKKGASLAQLMRIAARLNLVTRPLRLELAGLPYLRLPCILHWHFTHFVVLKAVKKGRLIVLDPAAGERSMTFAEASELFTGVALELWPEARLERVEQPKRVSIRQLIGRVSGLKTSLAHILVLALSLELFTLALPVITQLIIDNAVVSADRELLTTLAIAFAMLLVMQVATRAARAWATIHMGTTFNLQWRAHIFSHLIRLPVSYFEKRHVGDITSRFSSIDEIQRTVSTTFLESLLDGLFVVATVSVMLAYSPLLSVIVVAAAALYACVRWAFYGPLYRASQMAIFFGAKEDSHFMESARGIRSVKMFQREDERRSAWLTTVVDRFNSSLRVQKLEMFYEASRGLLAGAAQLLVLWIGAAMVIDGAFTIGALVAFMAYMSQFDGRVTKLIDNLMKIRVLRLHADRLGDIVLTEPEAHGSAADDDDGLPAEPGIEIRDVSFRYADEDPYILSHVDLTIRPGECVAIVGRSGCGKTTLLNLILGMLAPTEGSILICGVDPKVAGYEKVRRVMGVVMQEDTLFAGTIAENICFFDPEPDTALMEECATLAAIHADIVQMPMGYHTYVGEMGSVLSGGQKQRVLLARALYKRPKILVLDEATSHVDVEREREVNETLRSLRMTRIIVAHRPETVALADRCFLLEDGTLTEVPPGTAGAERRSGAPATDLLAGGSAR